MTIVAKGAPWLVFEGTRLTRVIVRDRAVHVGKLDEDANQPRGVTRDQTQCGFTIECLKPIKKLPGDLEISVESDEPGPIRRRHQVSLRQGFSAQCAQC